MRNGTVSIWSFGDNHIYLLRITAASYISHVFAQTNSNLSLFLIRYYQHLKFILFCNCHTRFTVHRASSIVNIHSFSNQMVFINITIISDMISYLRLIMMFFVQFTPKEWLLLNKWATGLTRICESGTQTIASEK